MKKHISDCCRAEVEVVGGDEGTNHWECVKCGKACNDLYYSNNQKAGWEVKLLNWLKSELTDDSKFEKICELIEAELANARREEREKTIGDLDELERLAKKKGYDLGYQARGKRLFEMIRPGDIIEDRTGRKYVINLLKTKQE